MKILLPLFLIVPFSSFANNVIWSDVVTEVINLSPSESEFVGKDSSGLTCKVSGQLRGAGNQFSFLQIVTYVSRSRVDIEKVALSDNLEFAATESKNRINFTQVVDQGDEPVIVEIAKQRRQQFKVTLYPGQNRSPVDCVVKIKSASARTR